MKNLFEIEWNETGDNPTRKSLAESDL